jgi:SAM-dependent methyltransferase
MASIHEAVRGRYRQAAMRDAKDSSDDRPCCGGSDSCCGSEDAAGQSTRFGYTIEELKLLPEGADLGLGCGNPTALAALSVGEVVVDLGSGAGIDCFLAARRVGDSGRVIGVDMTPEMVERARANAERAGFTNVEFRLGEIEHLPIADGSVDVIISNCVVNLAPEKDLVLTDALRVLKHGGRISISDLVLEREPPAEIRANIALLTGCVAGAMVKREFLSALERAGFVDVKIDEESPYLKLEHLASLAAEAGISEEGAATIAENVRSVTVSGRKA